MGSCPGSIAVRSAKQTCLSWKRKAEKPSSAPAVENAQTCTDAVPSSPVASPSSASSTQCSEISIEQSATAEDHIDEARMSSSKWNEHVHWCVADENGVTLRTQFPSTAHVVVGAGFDSEQHSINGPAPPRQSLEGACFTLRCVELVCEELSVHPAHHLPAPLVCACWESTTNRFAGSCIAAISAPPSVRNAVGAKTDRSGSAHGPDIPAGRSDAIAQATARARQRGAGTSRHRSRSDSLTANLWLYGLVRTSLGARFFDAVEAPIVAVGRHALAALAAVFDRHTENQVSGHRTVLPYPVLVAAVAEATALVDPLAFSAFADPLTCGDPLDPVAFAATSKRAAASVGDSASATSGIEDNGVEDGDARGSSSDAMSDAGRVWVEQVVSLLDTSDTSVGGMSSNAFVGAVLGRRWTAVRLNCYDLANNAERVMGRMFLGLDGIFHSGIVVGHSEYWYGGQVHSSRSERTPFGAPSSTITLGHTLWSERELLQSIRTELQLRFTVEGYHVLNLNCNDFCEAVSQLLLRRPIPEAIGRQSARAQRSVLVRWFFRPLARHFNSSQSGSDSSTAVRPLVRGSSAHRSDVVIAPSSRLPLGSSSCGSDAKELQRAVDSSLDHADSAEAKRGASTVNGVTGNLDASSSDSSSGSSSGLSAPSSPGGMNHGGQENYNVPRADSDSSSASSSSSSGRGRGTSSSSDGGGIAQLTTTAACADRSGNGAEDSGITIA